MNIKIKLVSTAVLLVSLSFTTQARNKIDHFDIKPAIEKGIANGDLDPKIKMIFGSGGSQGKHLGNYGTNKKTNRVGKTAEDACDWALLSALKTMQHRAKDIGAREIVNIKSNFKKNLFVSKTQFECGEGMLMVGVALTGDFIK